MEKILEKISSYHIFNYLIPGIVFAFLAKWYWDIPVIENNVFENLVLYYFCGMVISRIGSLIVEPICKKMKWVKYANYSDFISASKKDNTIGLLSEENNVYRTIIACIFMLLVGKLSLYVASNVTILDFLKREIVLIMLGVLFILAYRKQTKYIRDRINKNIEGDK